MIDEVLMRLLDEHPPTYLWVPPNMLANFPGSASTNAAWRCFRDQMKVLYAGSRCAWAGHLVECADDVLAWRAAVLTPPAWWMYD